MELAWPQSADEAMELPVEDLALRVVVRLAATKRWGGFHARRYQISEWVREWNGPAPGHTPSQILDLRSEWVETLAEAWEHARGEGLLAEAGAPHYPQDAYFLTRRASDLLEEEDPIGVLRAQRRLGVELHQRFAGRLRPLTRAGAFEQAALDALREVEVRVRELAGDSRRGVALMNHAFGEKGPLTDPSADPGEQQGMRALFSGAFGAVRNPLGHRSVEWADPTEAAEMVLLADLLMRQLDRIERRLGK
jgi:uncharacterized protein (TIGR02391 family)